VPDRSLSLAIGKEGQNARLAAKLTGWRIDIKNETEAAAEAEQFAAEREEAARRAEELEAARRAAAELLAAAEAGLEDDESAEDVLSEEAIEEAFTADRVEFGDLAESEPEEVPVESAASPVDAALPEEPAPAEAVSEELAAEPAAPVEDAAPPAEPEALPEAAEDESLPEEVAFSPEGEESDLAMERFSDDDVELDAVEVEEAEELESGDDDDDESRKDRRDKNRGRQLEFDERQGGGGPQAAQGEPSAAGLGVRQLG
jgi:N utilization substance protein A